MDKTMTQDQRLNFLVETFKADSDEYKGLVTPKDTDGKRRVLRSLMNIRMPGRCRITCCKCRMITCRAVPGRKES